MWPDMVLKGFLELLKQNTGLGVLILLLAFMLCLYVTPVGVLTWLNWDGANRIVAAIADLKHACVTGALAQRRE